MGKSKQNKRKAASKKQSKKKVQASSFQLPRWAPWVVLGLLSLTYLYVRSLFWAVPMERDEGIYAYFGKLILDGQIPYVDFYEHRLPGIFYMYAIIIGIFGDFEGLAAGFTLMNIGSMIWIYLVGRRLLNTTSGLIAAAIFALMSLQPESVGFTRQSEHIVAFWLSGGLFFTLRGLQDQKQRDILLGGIFMCLSFLTKPNGVLFILLGGGWVLGYYLFSGQIKKALKPVLVYSAGVFGTFGLLCLLMLVQGAFGEMWYWGIEYAGKYASKFSWDYGKQFFYRMNGRITDAQQPFWYLAAAGLILPWFVRSLDWWKRIGLFLLGTFSFASIFPGLHFYNHYWIMLNPAVGLMIAATFYSTQKALEGFEVPQVATQTASGLVVLFLIGYQVSKRPSYYSNPDLGIVVLHEYGAQPFRATVVLGAFLEERANEGDEIALVGAEPQVYIYSDLPSVTKHAYFSYLLADPERTPEVREWQSEYINAVEQKKPRFIMWAHNRISSAPRPGTDMRLFEFMDKHIQENYRRVALAEVWQPQVVNGRTTAPITYTYGADKLQNYQTTAIPREREFPYHIWVFERINSSQN